MNELVDRLGRDLSDRILEVFSASAFGNSYTFHPSRLPESSRKDAEQFLAFLDTPDEKAVKDLGEARARQGLGLQSVLALGRVLRLSCLRASQFDGISAEAALQLADRYMDAYLTGYFKGWEADLLLEQERTRKAYFASLFGREEGSTGGKPPG